MILLLSFMFLMIYVGNGQKKNYYFKTVSFQKAAYWKENKGEDAHFINSNDLGVFDGVGAWIEQGIDSGQYSTELANSIKNYVQQKRSKPGVVEIDLLRSLIYGYESNLFKNVSGSCTVCIASLNSISARLSVLNLGDSGLVVFRIDESPNDRSVFSLLNKASLMQYWDNQGKKDVKDIDILFKTQCSQHEFNTPFQIGSLGSDKMSENSPLMNIKFDNPRNAAVSQVSGIKENDIVLLASDGLLDNLFMHEIAKVLVDNMKPLFTNPKLEMETYNDENETTILENTIERLYNLTIEKQNDKKCTSPWSVALTKENQRLASKQYRFGFLNGATSKSQKDVEELGGKPDDLTIIMALVKSKVVT